jgi:hypothetical protein
MAMPDYVLDPRMQQQLANDPGEPGARWAWTKQRQEVLKLVIEGKLSVPQIAEKIDRRYDTVWTWIRHPQFKAKLATLQERQLEELQRITIANKVKRVEAAQVRHDKMNAVIDARAADPTLQAVPGGATGLLVRQLRAIGHGRNQAVIEDYAVDTGLLKEMREIEKQVAVECGQWQERLEPITEGSKNEYHLTLEDRRSFIVQIFSELGCPISPESLAGLADLTRPALPPPRAGDGQGGNDPGPVASGNAPPPG